MDGDFTENVEDREVGLGGRFEQPRFAVRVGAVVEDIREMSVKNDAETAEDVTHVLAMLAADARADYVGRGPDYVRCAASDTLRPRDFG